MRNVHQVDTEEYLNAVSALIAEGREVTVPVRGGSMNPFLVDNRDCVLLVPAPERLRRGDIVLFRRASEQYVLHRIVAVRRSRSGSHEPVYFMRGDAQEVTEGPVARAQVRALAARVMRQGRWLTDRDLRVLFFRHLWCRRYFPRRAALAVYRLVRRITADRTADNLQDSR